MFTSPGRSVNVLAFLAALEFGTLFVAWSAGYWLRTSVRQLPRDLSTWPITRQAVLSAAGVTALAVLAVNRVANAGAIALVILVVVAAELVLRRMRVRQ